MTQTQLFFLSLFAALCFGATKKPDVLTLIENRYQRNATLSMEVTKTTTAGNVGKVRVSKGKIQIKKGGKLRWDTLEPQKSMILMDGKNIWMVDEPVSEGEPVTVLKASNPKKSQPHTIVSFLMGKAEIKKGYDLKKVSEFNAEYDKVELTSKEKEPQITELALVVGKKHQTIKEIHFQDLIGNDVKLEFSNIEMGKKIKSEVFKYTPPKGAEVQVID